MVTDPVLGEHGPGVWICQDPSCRPARENGLLLREPCRESHRSRFDGALRQTEAGEEAVLLTRLGLDRRPRGLTCGQTSLRVCGPTG